MDILLYSINSHGHVFGEEICNVVRGSLRGDEIRDGLSNSVVVVIPKVLRPLHFSNFHPISLCNLLYKIISEVLANTLKVFLSDIISECESAVVPNKLIADSALVTFECLHIIKRKHTK